MKPGTVEGVEYLPETKFTRNLGYASLFELVLRIEDFDGGFPFFIVGILGQLFQHGRNMEIIRDFLQKWGSLADLVQVAKTQLININIQSL